MERQGGWEGGLMDDRWVGWVDGRMDGRGWMTGGETGWMGGWIDECLGG